MDWPAAIIPHAAAPLAMTIEGMTASETTARSTIEIEYPTMVFMLARTRLSRLPLGAPAFIGPSSRLPTLSSTGLHANKLAATWFNGISSR